MRKEQGGQESGQKREGCRQKRGEECEEIIRIRKKEDDRRREKKRG